jgi:hypothetical protein
VRELGERLEIAARQVDDRETVGECDEHAVRIRGRRRGADLGRQSDRAVLAGGGVVLVQRAAVDVDP